MVRQVSFLPALALAFVMAMIWACAGPSIREGVLPPGAEAVENNYRTTEQKLYSQFQKWKGTPYRSGGLSRSGVDCSGLVQLTYRDLFGMSLPRTVREQVKTGKRVRQRDLRAGDLVFFKTGIFQRHVGIYLDSRTFMHASAGSGVTISSLDSRHWSRRFWKARRLLD
jgi:cell wall-associated NlpC family hydrolase